MRTRNAELNRNRRATILRSAAACFVRQGFHATSMKDICTAAEMSPGTLYHYFRSKAEIIAGIVEDERLQIRDALAPLANAADLTAALFDVLERMVASTTQDDLVLHAEVAAEVLRQPALREMARAIEVEAQAVLAAAIRTAQLSGGVAPGLDPERTAVTLAALTDGLLWHATLHGLAQLGLQLPALRQNIRQLLAPAAAPRS